MKLSKKKERESKEVALFLYLFALEVMKQTSIKDLYDVLIEFGVVSGLCGAMTRYLSNTGQSYVDINNDWIQKYVPRNRGYIYTTPIKVLFSEEFQTFTAIEKKTKITECLNRRVNVLNKELGYT